MADKQSNFGVGLAIGAAIGAVTALFLSPKSGKENRELAKMKFAEVKKFIESKEAEKKIQEIFGNADAQSKKIYANMQKEMSVRMDEVKEAINNFDTKKYTVIANDILKAVQEKVEMSQEKADKAKKYLVDMMEEKKPASQPKKKAA